MYPGGVEHQTVVEVPDISDILCGASRPGHFRGVATVVSKLFNMVHPHDAFFGEKDFQQLQVIRTMVRDLSMGVTIHGIPTERDVSGLALSSRNGYLTDEQRHTAATIYSEMTSLKARIEAGERNYVALAADLADILTDSGFNNDYVHIVNAESLKPAKQTDKHLVILVAAFLGNTRLIDNLQIQL
jgi:pantoate--beta-alanine ligase